MQSNLRIFAQKMRIFNSENIVQKEKSFFLLNIFTFEIRLTMAVSSKLFTMNYLSYEKNF